MTYYALAYYIFESIDNPEQEVKNHKNFFKNRDVTGRIYIAHEGINGQMSGSQDDAEAYMVWLRQTFPSVKFKIHIQKENIFPRMTVKVRNQLVAIDESVDLSKTGEHVSPEQWRQMIESDEEYLLLDVRNNYEWQIGHFEGAELPALEKFRDFPKYADQLAQKRDTKKTKVMMYCTGGIRCELYSALLKERGFESVYQLDGGVIAYGQQEGQKHWKGRLFVFDDRLAVSIDGSHVDPIASCVYCKTPCDTQYNCANMDCNDLFVCCDSCTPQEKGCCSHSCQTAARVRPIELERGNKPFRRKHLLNK